MERLEPEDGEDGEEARDHEAAVEVAYLLREGHQRTEAVRRCQS